MATKLSWIEAATVALDAQTHALLVQPAGAGSLLCGAKVVADADVPELLVSTATPCRAVWLGAPVDADGIPTNTKPVFVGGPLAQTIPVMPANIEGLWLPIDDAAKLTVKVGEDGEGLSYAILI